MGAAFWMSRVGALCADAYWMAADINAALPYVDRTGVLWIPVTGSAEELLVEVIEPSKFLSSGAFAPQPDGVTGRKCAQDY